MISNCGHDERGKYSRGKAGDQTGTEWQVINWYNRPWKCVLRQCYGYYTDVSGVKWLYVAYKNVVGFASSKYLKK